MFYLHCACVMFFNARAFECNILVIVAGFELHVGSRYGALLLIVAF